jgi:8-oxo-dGTP diphosphatase
MNPRRYLLPHHFTASGLVFCRGRVLLINHKRIGGWVPPGGHIEATEMPEQTVVREILEETGVSVEVMSEPAPETGDVEAFFLANPIYVQSVLAVEEGERFYHVDLAYLCRPHVGNTLDENGLPLLSNSEESEEVQWVPLAELGTLTLAKNVKEALDVASLEQATARFTRVAWHSADIDKLKR